MDIKFDNGWMTLKAKSMGKLHTITNVVSTKEKHDHLFNTKDRVTVSGLPKTSLCDDLQLMAPSYSGDTKTQLKDMSTQAKPYTNLYIQTDGHHFQVAFVALTAKMGNDFMNERDDTALICSTEATEDVPALHFIASNIPA